MSLRLVEWSAVAQIVSAIAVVVSLIYVGLELNRNTVSLRASTFQTAADSVTGFSAMVAAQPDLARIWTEGLQDLESLMPDERVRFYFLMATVGRRIESAFVQRQAGILDRDQWATFASVCSLFGLPGGRAWLAENPSNFTPAFHQFVEGGCK